MTPNLLLACATPFDNSTQNVCTLTLRGNDGTRNVSRAGAVLLNALWRCDVRMENDDDGDEIETALVLCRDYFIAGPAGEGFGLGDLAACFEEVLALPVYWREAGEPEQPEVQP